MSTVPRIEQLPHLDGQALPVMECLWEKSKPLSVPDITRILTGQFQYEIDAAAEVEIMLDHLYRQGMVRAVQNTQQRKFAFLVSRDEYAAQHPLPEAPETRVNDVCAIPVSRKRG